MSDSSILCGACGAENSADSLICTKCGALLAAYQSGPNPTATAPSVEPPNAGPVKSETPGGEPSGATTPIVGWDEIGRTPILVEPIAFDSEGGDPGVAADFLDSDNEPIEAEFHEKPRPAAPSPKSEPDEPQVVVATAVPGSGGPQSEFPSFEDGFGSRPAPVKVVFWQMGRTPGCMLGWAILLLVIACPVLIVAGGRKSDALAVISFCLAFIAVLGIVGALIVFARRKLAR